MASTTAIDSLRGLILSSTELKEMTGLPDAFIRDYLDILENFVSLATLLDIEIDQKIEEIPTDFRNGSIPFASGGLLVEENPGLVWWMSVLSIVGDMDVSGSGTVGETLFVGGDIKGPNRAKQYFFAGL